MKTIIDITLEKVAKLEEKWNKTFNETVINQNKYIVDYNRALRRKINALYLVNLITIITTIIINLWR